MAAIIESRRFPAPSPQRPALRLVTADGRRTQVVPVELGLEPAHLAAAVAAVVFVVLLTIAIGSGALAALAPAPAGAGGTAAPRVAAPAAAATAQTVTVRPGDSLWSIARRIQPTGDVRDLVDRLARANGSGALQPGDQIVVPS